MKSIKTSLLATLLYLVGIGFAAAQSATNVMTPVFVELASPKPTVVARYEAAQRGEAFDEELHRASIRMAQDAFLNNLLISGVGYNLSSTELASGVVKEHRFTDLINAVRIEALGWDMSLVRNAPNVKHVTVDEVQQLHLNNSVRYIRANGPDSARTMGVRGAGSVNNDGSAEGQVIAVLDTGLDHTNPMFDLRFDDTDYECRGRSLDGLVCDDPTLPAVNGDTRAPRLAGTAYMPGTNHPKVAYRFDASTSPVLGDDTGHGTNSGTTAGGLLALADSTVNSGEIVEGVAPGAVMMDYKVCPSLSCVTTLSILSLEDCIQPTDDLGNPKPICTVVNMSYGSDAGDPYSAGGIAAGNLQYAGTVPVASAGNEGPQENIVGSPSSTRTVISVAATNDPGISPNSIDQLDAAGSTIDNFLAFFAPESNAAQGNISTAIQAQYANVGFGDTPAHYAGVDVLGKICLSERGSTVDGGAAGTGLFGNKAAQCLNNGGIALLIYNNAPGQMGSVLAPSSLPVFTTSGEAGAALTAMVPIGSTSDDDIRINPADSALFEPATTGFSSRGPNNDFLVVKPDITAPGEEILMGASKVGALGNPTSFGPASGTSFSGPHIAGVAALMRDSNARPDLTPSQVRAAMMNTATNLRLADGTELPDSDARNFIHETGAGLVESVEAINVGAIMGTNELNGAGGPDNSADPNFLPSYSFGERAWIGTGVNANDLSQQATITVTMENVGTGAGMYNLSLVDGGADRGDITRPITEQGFEISLSDSTVGLADIATFDVTVAVSGTPGGLQIAGADVNGAEATEFLWFVVADNGSERIRMPMFLRVVQGGAPVLAANDDSALTTPDTAVDIDVLANDTGEGIEIISVTTPGNGAATINMDGTINYNPNPGFAGTDSFSYTIEDVNGAQASANVQVTVAAQCQATGEYFADFESGDGGFTVDTASGSVAWALSNDPFAQSGSMSWSGEATLPEVKDDRLVSPAIVVSQDSELIFYHRFKFDVGSTGGIDGGVLEISTDGGMSWTDIVAAGGSFVAGGYNGVMRTNPNGGGFIAGRDAWTGFSTFIDAMNEVRVNLSSFSGQEIQLRWRLTLDNTIVIGDLGTPWFVDDVRITNTGCDEVNTNLAPTANDDAAQTVETTPVVIDVVGGSTPGAVADTDPENDPLTITAVTSPSNGSVFDNGDGTVTYTADAGFIGTDTFDYTISDGNGNQDSATVTVTVDDEVDPNPDDNGKVTGGGWIPDGDGKANFGFNAHAKSAGVKGQFQFNAKETGFSMHGNVTYVRVDGNTAEFGGVCKDGSCTFDVYVEDNADSGRGADRLHLSVDGGATFEADDLLGGGNIKIH